MNDNKRLASNKRLPLKYEFIEILEIHAKVFDFSNLPIGSSLNSVAIEIGRFLDIIGRLFCCFQAVF